MAQLYKGLASYQENEAEQFKGRTVEIQEMYDNFLRNEYLVCYADSGEGKSSIIEAGLIPKLRQSCYHPIHIIFENKDFSNENIDFDKFVCDTITKELDSLKSDPNIKVDIVYPQKLIKKTDKFENAEWEKEMIDSVAWLRLRYSMLTIDNLVFTPVLIFDQFEEVFTNPKSQEWTNRLFVWLQELTMDLCPKEIVNELERKIGNERFPLMATQKHFKAIFSLRSEYIGQLDYWGMQKHYIPQLKNNRYLLRPLTIEGAREVITQQDGYNGLADVVDEIIDTIRKSQKGKNFVENNTSYLPCIPALLLSVICSKAYGMSEQERCAFIEKLKGEKSISRGDAINEIIEEFYNEAITMCEIPNGDLEIIEDVLVNSEGVRQRISSESDVLKEIDFSKSYLQKFKDARLIRVISEYNREDRLIELIHDCLCGIVLKRKEERQKIKESVIRQMKIKSQKLKDQREDAFSGIFLLFLFIFVVFIISSVYQDKSIYKSFLDLNGDGVVNYYKEQVLFNIILSNLAILPILVYSAVKKLKITSLLSIYSFISNAVLLYFFITGQNEQRGIIISLVGVAIGVPLITLIYSYIFHLFGLPTRDDYRTILNSIPLTLFFLVLSIYIFYLSVFNDTIGFPKPRNSSWGVLVIPLILHELIKSLFKIESQWLSLRTFVVLLGLMTYNTINDHLFFNYYIAIFIVLCVLATLLSLYHSLPFGKKAWAVLLQSVVIITILVLNLGFNPLKVNYDSVVGVYSWKEISVKDGDNHLGVVEACKGDTLLPCVFDSLKNNEDFCACLSTNKVQHISNVMSYNSRYSYCKETGHAKCQNLYLPSMEYITYKIANKKKLDNTLADTISYYAARTHFESRKANISLLLGDGDLSLTKIPSLEKLYKYQLKELNQTLISSNNIIDSIGRIDGNWTAKINKSFARTFYLCLLRDRIVKEDTANVFSLCQEILPLYFYDLSKNINFNIKTNYNIKFGDFHKSYVTKIDLSNILKEGDAPKIETWFSYIEFFTLLDMSLNAESYSSSVEKQVLGIITDTQNMIENIEINMRKQDNILSKLKHLTDNENLSADQVLEAIKLAVNGYKEIVSVRGQLKNTSKSFSEKLSELKEERVQIDMDFRNMINNVFLALPSFVTETPSVYDANFTKICEFLYMVAAVRLYDMSSVYLQQLEYMDVEKMNTYAEFKKIQKEKAEMLNKISEKVKKITK